MAGPRIITWTSATSCGPARAGDGDLFGPCRCARGRRPPGDRGDRARCPGQRGLGRPGWPWPALRRSPWRREPHASQLVVSDGPGSPARSGARHVDQGPRPGWPWPALPLHCRANPPVKQQDQGWDTAVRLVRGGGDHLRAAIAPADPTHLIWKGDHRATTSGKATAGHPDSSPIRARARRRKMSLAKRCTARIAC